MVDLETSQETSGYMCTPYPRTPPQVHIPPDQSRLAYLSRPALVGVGGGGGQSGQVAYGRGRVGSDVSWSEGEYFRLSGEKSGGSLGQSGQVAYGLGRGKGRVRCVMV